MRSINELKNKIKRVVELVERQDIFIVLLLIIVSTTSFGLGRLSAIDESKTPLKINFEASQQANIANIVGKYVASKNGTKYHLPWCSGAQRISEKNKIWFKTKEEAENKGYTPASNCKGI